MVNFLILSALIGLSLASGYGSGGGQKNQGGDMHKYCCWWAMTGKCDSNPYWMRPNCQFSCGTPGCHVKDAEACAVSVNLEGCPWKDQQTTMGDPMPEPEPVCVDLGPPMDCWDPEPVKNDAGCTIDWKCGPPRCFGPGPKPEPDDQCVDHKLQFGVDACEHWRCVFAEDEEPDPKPAEDCIDTVDWKCEPRPKNCPPPPPKPEPNSECRDFKLMYGGEKHSSGLTCAFWFCIEKPKDCTDLPSPSDCVDRLPVKDDSGCIIDWKCGYRCVMIGPKPEPDSQCIDFIVVVGDDWCVHWSCVSAEEQVKGYTKCLHLDKGEDDARTVCASEPEINDKGCITAWSCVGWSLYIDEEGVQREATPSPDDPVAEVLRPTPSEPEAALGTSAPEEGEPAADCIDLPPPPTCLFPEEPVKDDAGCTIDWKCFPLPESCPAPPPKPEPNSECQDFKLLFGGEKEHSSGLNCAFWLCVPAYKENDCPDSPSSLDYCIDRLPVKDDSDCITDWKCGSRCLLLGPKPEPDSQCVDFVVVVGDDWCVHWSCVSAEDQGKEGYTKCLHVDKGEGDATTFCPPEPAMNEKGCIIAWFCSGRALFIDKDGVQREEAPSPDQPVAEVYRPTPSESEPETAPAEELGAEPAEEKPVDEGYGAPPRPQIGAQSKAGA